ncbi:hypothetical protein QL285_061276 [Trifolium repens]|nr:hypothetical protein QL285_061276 [Trifolium repens]
MSPLPAPTPSFEIGENPNPYPNPVNSGFPRQSGYGLGGYPRVWVLLPCLEAGTHHERNSLHRDQAATTIYQGSAPGQ